MMMTGINEAPAVICLGGPTGCGKTGIAAKLARELDGEVINADSRQVYADFPIITAQPDGEEKRGIPHHLYGFLPVTMKMSAGQWIELAHARAVQIIQRGKIPVLSGGTGLYFQALLRGIAAIPPVPEAISREIEERVNALGPESHHALLGRLDPEYAAKTHPRDRQRIQRALEVLEATGKPFSWWHRHAMSAPLCKGPLFVINAPLAWLEPRLAARIDQMLARGAIGEAEKAREKCADADAPGWSGIGCAELLRLINRKIDLPECRRLWLKNTRAYAKRQLTWFRQRKEAVFFEPSAGDGIVEAAKRAVR